MASSYQYLDDKLAGVLPDFDEINKVFNEMIVSVSGWRKIFAISQDEQDNSEEVSLADAFLVAIATLSCVKSLPYTKVILSHDARPTGPSIALIAMRILLALHIEVTYIGTSSAPEAFAYSKKDNNSYFLI